MSDDNLPQWPDDPEFDAEFAAHRASEARGEIVRGDIIFDAERDFVTNSALRAMLRDAHAMLRQANAENRELRESLDAQTKFTADLYKQQEVLKVKQAAIQRTLDTLSACIQ